MEYLLTGLAVSFLIVGLLAYSAKKGIDWDRDNQSHLTNPDNWVGPFYINSDDNRIFLQKRRAGGATVNFGNPLGILITAIFFGFMAWVIYVGG